jgi:hypothetical protein
MCVRISISLARVASSTVALAALEPEVPVAPGVEVEVVADADEPVSLPIISVMILSTAATSVPQFLFAFADLFPPLLFASGALVLAPALADAPML